MSRQLINRYRAEFDRLRQVSGSRRESVLREAFKDLLKRWGKAHDLQFVPEHDIITPQKTRIYVDGALLHALRVPFATGRPRTRMMISTQRSLQNPARTTRATTSSSPTM